MGAAGAAEAMAEADQAVEGMDVAEERAGRLVVMAGMETAAGVVTCAMLRTRAQRTLLGSKLFLQNERRCAVSDAMTRPTPCVTSSIRWV